MVESDYNALETKKIKIKDSEFLIKELSYADEKKLRKKFMKYNAETGKTSIEDFDSYNDEKLLICIVKAPFEVNLDNLGKMKRSVILELLTEINKLSEIGVEEEKK